MKAVVFQGPGRVTVEELPEPTMPEPTDAIVRVTMSTICGTDIRILDGRIPMPPGTPIGHEFVGVVEEVGAAVETVKPGQRVVSPFSTFCGRCFYCRTGILTACRERRFFGTPGMGGAQAEYVRVPRADATLEPLPDPNVINDTQAAFLSDVLPGTFAGLEMGGLKAGDVVAVVGCGPTGLCAQLCAHHMGAATVFAIDHHDYRLEAARKLGSIPIDYDREDARSKVLERTEGRGADVAAEATGMSEGVRAALALTRPWGTVVNLGVFFDQSMDFPIGQWVLGHITLKPAGIPPVKRYIPRLVKLMAQGRLDPSPIASHVLPLAEAPRGYELMARRQDGALKVVLKP